jgi:hypothetical protein
MIITRYDGPEILAAAGQPGGTHGAVFSQPPFNRDIDSVEHFHARLDADVHQLGFQVPAGPGVGGGSEQDRGIER